VNQLSEPQTLESIFKMFDFGLPWLTMAWLVNDSMLL
jgi:hypothetical protein